MELVKTGATRWVILTRRWAIKVPACWNYRSFLLGLLANRQERAVFRNWDPARCEDDMPVLCPISFSLPGGWLVVMPRCEPMTHAEYSTVDYTSFIQIDEDRSLPIEDKAESFGKLNGAVVAIDYGGYGD